MSTYSTCQNLGNSVVAVKRHLARVQLRLKDGQIEKLIARVGRHPGLLRYACELVGAETVSLKQDRADMVEQLLAADLIERQCREIWQDLELMAVEDAVRRAAYGDSIPSHVAETLTRCGIFEISSQGDLKFTSPVFKRFVEKFELSLSSSKHDVPTS